MVNKEVEFTGVCEMIDPEIVLGDERESIVLAEVRELPIDLAANERAIYQPHRERSHSAQLS